jgi:hypothetical protein
MNELERLWWELKLGPLKLYLAMVRAEESHTLTHEACMDQQWIDGYQGRNSRTHLQTIHSTNK